MVTRGDGRGAGEAIVVLPNHMEMQMALSRDKQHMGRRCAVWPPLLPVPVLAVLAVLVVVFICVRMRVHAPVVVFRPGVVLAYLL